MRPALEVVIVVCCAMACSSPSSTPEEKQAPLPPVAAVVPAEPADASPEPAVAPETVRWIDLEIAEGCTVRVAENPAAFDLRLDWKPCAAGPPGCREVSTRLGDDLFDGGRHLRGGMHRGKVSLVASFSLPGPVLQHAIAPLDGAPFVVFEQPPDADCSVGVGAVSEDGAVIEVGYDNVGGYASRAYLRGPLREDSSWTEIAARLLRSEFPRYTGEAELSVGGRVAIAASGGPIRWFDPATGKWVKVPGSKGGWACCFEGHGDYVTFMLESIPERVMAAKLGEPAHELRPVVKGGGTSPIAIDGDRAIWLEGRGRDKNNIYSRIELRTGEVSEELKIADARLLTALPTAMMARPALNDGVAVIPLHKRGAPSGFGVIRLTERQLEFRLLEPPEGLVNERLLWVTSDEIAVMVGPGGNHLGRSTIRRIPIGGLPRIEAPVNEDAK